MIKVLVDANVLYGQTPRNLMMYLGWVDAVHLHWTDEILDECFENLSQNREDLDPAKLARTRSLMLKHQPRAMVMGYEPLIEGLSLPDAGDRHVLAAAIHGDVKWIVTNNIKDFPVSVLAGHGLKRTKPDGLVNLLLDHVPGRVIQAITNLQQAKRRPPRGMEETLALLARNGFSTSVRLYSKTK